MWQSRIGLTNKYWVTVVSRYKTIIGNSTQVARNYDDWWLSHSLLFLRVFLVVYAWGPCFLSNLSSSKGPFLMFPIFLPSFLPSRFLWEFIVLHFLWCVLYGGTTFVMSRVPEVFTILGRSPHDCAGQGISKSRRRFRGAWMIEAAQKHLNRYAVTFGFNIARTYLKTKTRTCCSVFG